MKVIKQSALIILPIFLAGCSSTTVKTADMSNNIGESHTCVGKVMGSSISLGNHILAARNRDSCIEIMEKKGFIAIDEMGFLPPVANEEDGKLMVAEKYKTGFGLKPKQPAILESVNNTPVHNIEELKAASFGKSEERVKLIFKQNNSEQTFYMALEPLQQK
ncbi:hypothetical protein [Alkalimarinus sediminis]|uniref:Lipoprotein n=1 Tax=Alkalimarinus sediminis TaxID=1632866 RepID=A0A9E8KP12_9ALTE|nr:hypothetical protein [Alkalimarinus sediminis]UZW74254.1 hypothetical protein NNL22_14675 [Alkalimarinus sediminis]